MSNWAKPVQRSERYYLELEISVAAIIEAFVPPVYRGEGFKWSVHSSDDGNVRIIRMQGEEWEAAAEGEWRPKADERDDMIVSKKEVLDMIGEHLGKTTEGSEKK